MRPPKILLVDDCADIGELLALQLRFLGWDVTTACSGRKALETIKCFKPHLILLDMCMPEMDGFELARILKGDPVYSDIPIVATTGLSDPLELDRCIEAGCCDSIVKPFTLKELQERLYQALAAGNLAHDP